MRRQLHLFSKNKKRIASQHTHREVLLKREAKGSWQLSEFILNGGGPVDRSWGVKPVDDFVVFIYQSLQCRVFGEEVKILQQVPALRQTIAVKKRVHREIQNLVENLKRSKRFYFPKEAEIVFLMLQNIQDQQQIEMRVRLLSDISQTEVKAVVLSVATELNRLRGDVVSQEKTFRGHMTLQLPQHLSGPAANFSNCLRRKMIARKHLQNAFRLPGGVLGVPLRDLLKILAAKEGILWHVFSFLPSFCLRGVWLHIDHSRAG